MKLKKNYLFLLLSFLAIASALGQTQSENYVKTIQLLEPVGITSFSSNSDVRKKLETVTYLDGFGQAKQSIAIKQSPNRKDLAQHLELDQFGRTTKQYLVLPTLQNNGNFVLGAVAKVFGYYQNDFSDSHPFSEVRYDNSPLNRRLESSGPGDSWQISSTSDLDHTMKFEYGVNDVEEVFRFDIDETNQENPLIQSFYSQEQLVKNVIKNENWTPSDGNLNTKVTFTDKNGKKVAEFNYEVGENGSNNIIQLSTYYVYDKLGNLRYILTPKMFNSDNNLNFSDYAVQWPMNDFWQQGNSGFSSVLFSINNNVLKLNTGLQKSGGFPNKVLNSQIIKSLATSSTVPDMYLGPVRGGTSLVDNNGNPVTIHIGEANIVNGNLVITRISSSSVNAMGINVEINFGTPQLNQQTLDDLAFQYKYDDYNRQIEQKVPGKDWEYMVYDQLDRPILTQDANLRLENKWMFNKYDVFGRVVYSGIHINGSSREVLQNQVDSYISSSSNKANIEIRRSTPLSVGGILMNYTNSAYPTSSLETLTVSYFDDYNFSDSDAPARPDYIFGEEVTRRTKGLPTASWVKVLESSSWSKNYIYYDNEGRVISTFDNNYLGGNTQTKSKLDFRGKVEYSITEHKRLSSSLGISTKITDRFEYDHVERPKKHYQQINEQEEELIAHNSYNELGQLEKKSVGGDLGVNSSENFKDLVHLDVSGNTITKTLNSSSWNAGLATKGMFTDDGYVQFTAVYNQTLMVGLSTDNSSAGYNTIDYAIYLTQANGAAGSKRVYIYEFGSNKGWPTTYFEGDIFSVEREGNRISYKKNGQVFYTSLTPSSGNLIGDVSIHKYNHKIKNLKISSDYTDIVGLRTTNISSDSQEIRKKVGSSGWNAGAASVSSIQQGGDGYVSYKISQSNKYMMVGLSDINTNANYNTIDFAIYNHNARVYVRENGINKGLFTDYEAHDEFTIERVGSTINYKKNGDIFYTSLTSSTSRLIADMSFFHVGGAIYDLEVQNIESGLQTIDYIYNIRGWATGINDANNLGGDLFAYTLKYDDAIEGSASGDALYNGNIRQVIWRSAQNNLKKSYVFQYDKLDRFSKSIYRENNALTGGAGKFETYGVNYDSNGNIKALDRSNQVGSTMDRLLYQYDTGNRLTAISDNTTDTNGFNDGSTAIVDYFYDNNGNLTKDLNKGIASIEYNHLDLVEKVVFNNNDQIQFTYDANGNKLKMETNTSGNINTVDYLGGFQYTNTQLQFFPTSEGYVAKDGGAFKYVYIYRDHLDNTRLSYTDGNNDGIINPVNEVLSNTDYYVMGLTHSGEYISGIGSSYNYKYQGKEQLTFAGYNMYDFGSRMYDTSVGRWFNADPQNQFWSPYLAMGNNYIVITDPNGEYALIDDILAITIGGTVNVIANWGNIESFGDGAAYFGIGALAGEASLYGTPIAGAAILSAGNSAFTQYKNTGAVDPGDLIRDTVIGTATAGIGAKVAPIIAPYTNKLFSNSGSLLSAYLSDATANTISGIGLSTTAGLVQGQNFETAFGNATSLEAISQSLAISVVGTTGTHLSNKYHSNKIEKQRDKVNNLESEFGKESIAIPAVEDNGNLTKYSPYQNETGAILGSERLVTLKEGMYIGRFGSDYGSYFTDPGNTFQSLSLTSNPTSYSLFRVQKTFTVEKALIAPLNGQQFNGFHTQYKSFVPTSTLLNPSNQYLSRIYRFKIK